MAAWLAWSCSPQDGPILFVLALVLVVWAVGWDREGPVPKARRTEDPPGPG